MSNELIARRVERLERSLRRWQRGSCLAVGVSLLAVVMGFSQPDDPKSLRARDLTIVNREGRAVARLGSDSNGNGHLQISNADSRGSLIAGYVGRTALPALTLENSQRLARVQIEAHEDGGVLYIYDGPDVTDPSRAVQVGRIKGSSGIMLRSRNGTPAYMFPNERGEVDMKEPPKYLPAPGTGR